MHHFFNWTVFKFIVWTFYRNVTSISFLVIYVRYEILLVKIHTWFHQGYFLPWEFTIASSTIIIADQYEICSVRNVSTISPIVIITNKSLQNTVKDIIRESYSISIYLYFGVSFNKEVYLVSISKKKKMCVIFHNQKL